MRALHRDKEMLEKKILTLLAENKMNVSEVARILCYHTNTIMYHIRQIHAATGKNPLNLFDLADLLGWIDVVRCDDCKHCCLVGPGKIQIQICYNPKTPWFDCEGLVEVKDSDFCSYGERERR